MDWNIAVSTMPEFRYRSQICSRTRPALQDSADRGLKRCSLADLQVLQHIRCEVTVLRARRGVDRCVLRCDPGIDVQYARDGLRDVELCHRLIAGPVRHAVH